MWVCTEWQLIEEQTLALIRYLAAEKKGLDHHQTLLLSKAVSITDNLDFFVKISHQLLSCPQAELVLAHIKEHGHSSTFQKISTESYCGLFWELVRDDNKHLIEVNKDLLVSKPMPEWKSFIEQL